MNYDTYMAWATAWGKLPLEDIKDLLQVMHNPHMKSSYEILFSEIANGEFSDMPAAQKLTVLTMVERLKNG